MDDRGPLARMLLTLVGAEYRPLDVLVRQVRSVVTWAFVANSHFVSIVVTR
jgi:hypothetical protein